jgi:glutaminase
MALNQESKTGQPHRNRARKGFLHRFKFIREDPAEIFIFYRSACAFRSVLQF